MSLKKPLYIDTDGEVKQLQSGDTIDGGGGLNARGLEAAFFDGQGSVVLVNSIKYFRAKTAGTISAWSIIAEGTSPTCTIDIWKIASGTALPTVSNSIVAAAPPQLTSNNAVKSTTMTGWTTAYAADDIFAIKITACANATKIVVDIYS